MIGSSGYVVVEAAAWTAERTAPDMTGMSSKSSCSEGERIGVVKPMSPFKEFRHKAGLELTV